MMPRLSHFLARNLPVETAPPSPDPVPPPAPAATAGPSAAAQGEPSLSFWPSLRPRRVGDWLAVAALAMALFAFGAFDVHTYDTGLYVAKGRFTVTHLEIPTPDRMLCSERPTETSHTEKWLFQLIVAGLDGLGGPSALVFYGMFSIGLTFGFVAMAGREKTGGWVVPCACALLGCLVGYERFTMRPELVTFPLAAVFLYVYERFEGRTSRWLWLLPALQVVWTNSHPLFPLGPLLAGFYAGDPLLRGIWGWWREEQWPAAIPRPVLRQRVAVGFAVTAACLVNPHFLQGALYPFRFYRHIQDHAEVFSSHVTEFRGTFDYEVFPTAATAAFQVALLLTFAVLLLNAKRTRPLDWGMFLVFAWLACALRRNLGVFAVVTIPLLARNLGMVLDAWGERLRPRFRDLSWLAPAAGGFLLLVGAIYVTVDLATNRFYIAEREPRRFGFGITDVSYPIDAVKYIDSAGLHGHAFTNWDAGSYLLWAAYPKSKPYISSEGDYSYALFDEYRKVLAGEIPFQTIVARYNIRYSLIRYTIGDTEKFLRALAIDPQWVLTYADSVAVVFLRRVPENEAAIRAVEGRDPVRQPGGSGQTAYEQAHPWFRLGILYGLLGRADDATRALRKATELFPAYAEAQNNYGADLALKRDAKGAETAFRAALEANPKYFTPYMNLGALFFNEHKDYAKAEEAYRTALAETVPRGWFRALGGFFRTQAAVTVREYVLWNALGTALAMQDRYDDAVDAFQQSLEVQENLEALEKLFRIYRDALRDDERAQRYYNRMNQWVAPPDDSGRPGR